MLASVKIPEATIKLDHSINTLKPEELKKLIETTSSVLGLDENIRVSALQIVDNVSDYQSESKEIKNSLGISDEVVDFLEWWKKKKEEMEHDLEVSIRIEAEKTKWTSLNYRGRNR